MVGSFVLLPVFREVPAYASSCEREGVVLGAANVAPLVVSVFAASAVFGHDDVDGRVEAGDGWFVGNGAASPRVLSHEEAVVSSA